MTGATLAHDDSRMLSAVTCAYGLGIFLGINLKLFVMWQKRNEVKAVPEPVEGAPARRSRFGRPLRAKA